MNIENYNFPLLICSIIYFSCRFWKHFESYYSSEKIDGMSVADILTIVYFILAINVIYCVVKLSIRHGVLTIICYIFAIFILYFVNKKKDDNRTEGQKAVYKFSSRLRSILRKGMEILLFIGILPFQLLTSEYIFVDTVNFYIFSLLLFVSFSISSFAYFFSVYALQMKYQCKKIGKWEKYKGTPEKSYNLIRTSWNKDVKYWKNSIVYYHNSYYVGKGKTNLCIPGDLMSQLFYLIFKKPHKTYALLKLIMSCIPLIETIRMIYSGYFTMFGLSSILHILFFLFSTNLHINNGINK